MHIEVPPYTLLEIFLACEVFNGIYPDICRGTSGGTLRDIDRDNYIQIDMCHTREVVVYYHVYLITEGISGSGPFALISAGFERNMTNRNNS